jgi:carboxymethylenebutenolidase
MTALETIPTADGPVSAYIVGDGPPVVVLQEYWGVVPQICGVADRLAEAGFRVAVPDLYDGASTDDRDEAAALMMGLDVDRACRRSEATLAWLGAGRGACVGFCMGGGLAMALAARPNGLGASVVFYGNVPWPDVRLDWSADTSPLLLHYASDDTWATPAIGAATWEAVTGAGAHAELYVYDGAQHAFLDETRPESYDPYAAALAWHRTLAFLHRTLLNEPADGDLTC